jgi:hypothetical protein
MNEEDPSRICRVLCSAERHADGVMIRFLTGAMTDERPTFSSARVMTPDAVDILGVIQEWLLIMASAKKNGDYDSVVTAFGVADERDELLMKVMKGIIEAVSGIAAMHEAFGVQKIH